MSDTFKHLRGDKPPIGNDMADRLGALHAVLDDERRRARRAVAGRSRNAADARHLLDVLGILDP